MVRGHSLCLDCLHQGHFTSQCQSPQRCVKETSHQRKPHTMLHHDDVSAESKSSLEQSEPDHSKKPVTGKVINHFTNWEQGSVLLMTCQIIIQGPNGSHTKARAPLHSGSEASFITERIAQQLHLSCCHSPMIGCIGGALAQIRPRGPEKMQVTDRCQVGKIHSVEALVLPRTTSTILASPAPSRQYWKHLQ